MQLSRDGDLWFNIRIADPQLASGPSVRALIEVALRDEPAGFVIAQGLEWVGPADAFPEATRDGTAVLQVAELLRALERVVQIVWADFFFLAAEEAPPETDASLPYSDAIPRSLFTVCVSDNTDFYVYTRSPHLCAALRDSYPHLEVEERQAHSPRFPG